jgi:hypothetical protein
MPFKDYPEVENRLLDPSPLTEAEIRDLMRFNRQIDDKGQRRLYVELSLQNLAAVHKFEESSGNLTKVIVVLTVITTIATILAAVPALHSLCGK